MGGKGKGYFTLPRLSLQGKAERSGTEKSLEGSKENGYLGGGQTGGNSLDTSVRLRSVGGLLELTESLMPSPEVGGCRSR